MANTKNYDEKTKSILKKILVAARDSSFVIMKILL